MTNDASAVRRGEMHRTMLVTALGHLDRCLSLLDPFDSPAAIEAKGNIANAIRCLTAEKAGPTGNLDEPEERLNRLLEIAGPEDGAELLARLEEDLGTCARNIAHAKETSSREKMRDATHILVSLAGTVGAEQLESSARELNRLAHTGTDEEIAPMAMCILTGLASLQVSISQRRAEWPSDQRNDL